MQIDPQLLALDSPGAGPSGYNGHPDPYGGNQPHYGYGDDSEAYGAQPPSGYDNEGPLREYYGFDDQYEEGNEEDQEDDVSDEEEPDPVTPVQPRRRGRGRPKKVIRPDDADEDDVVEEEGDEVFE